MYCREIFAYASAARRRTYDGGDGDGGCSGGGGSGALFISVSSHTSPYVLSRADCSYLIGGDFNATIKHRLAGRIKEINGKYDARRPRRPRRRRRRQRWRRRRPRRRRRRLRTKRRGIVTEPSSRFSHVRIKSMFSSSGISSGIWDQRAQRVSLKIHLDRLAPAEEIYRN